MRTTRVGFLLSFAVGLTSHYLAGCGGGGYSSPPPPPSSNPVPTISSVSPSSAVAGGAALTLTVNGTNFISSSAVQWNGSVRPTTYLSSTQVQAQISASDIAAPGLVNVTILNPAPGASTSGNAVFTIASVGVIQTISAASNGMTPNGNSHHPAVNLDGRFVAFASEATNLISPNTQFAEAYLRNTCLGVVDCSDRTCDPASAYCNAARTVLASATNGFPPEGNSPGGANTSISADGRFVGFSSTATNLVSPNTVAQQYYVRDTCAGVVASGCIEGTVLASVNQSSGEPNAAASDGMLASSACYVAFVSSATDVVTGVTIPGEIYLSSCSFFNFVGFSNPVLVSANNLNQAANQGAQQPAISGDGRFVAFASVSSNLPGAPGGGPGLQNIYVRDTCIGATACNPSTTMVSLDSIGNPIAGNSQTPAISDDGRFVVFSSQVPVTGGNTGVVYLRDNCNSSTGPVPNCVPSTTTVAQGAANTASNSTNRAISADGRFILFDSNAPNLVNAPTVGNQVYVRDTCVSSTGPVSGCVPTTVLISVDSAGSAIGGGSGAISRDGHFAAFENETVIAQRFQIFLAATGF